MTAYLNAPAKSFFIAGTDLILRREVGAILTIPMTSSVVARKKCLLSLIEQSSIVGTFINYHA